jgi:hypothetical protein
LSEHRYFGNNILFISYTKGIANLVSSPYFFYHSSHAQLAELGKLAELPFSKSKANVELILISIMKICIQYHLVAWNKNVFYQDVDLGKNCDQNQIISKWWELSHFDLFKRNTINFSLCLYLFFLIFFSTEFNQWIKKCVEICLFLNLRSPRSQDPKNPVRFFIDKKWFLPVCRLESKFVSTTSMRITKPIWFPFLS